MASILWKSGSGGQFQSLLMSTPRGALQSGGNLVRRLAPELFREFCEAFTQEANRLRMEGRASLESACGAIWRRCWCLRPKATRPPGRAALCKERWLRGQDLNL
jgi:hypothetical protein